MKAPTYEINSKYRVLADLKFLKGKYSHSDMRDSMYTAMRIVSDYYDDFIRGLESEKEEQLI